MRSEELFDEIQTWPGVVYPIPTVMMNPREVAVRVSSSKGIYRDEIRLLPSSSGDPLLTRLTGDVPIGDGVVVTADFAVSAGIRIGEGFRITVTRIENDKRKRVQIETVVNGIIPSDILPSPTILGIPKLERDVENYRSGISVPERGWKGVEMDSRQSYAYVIEAANEELGETLKSNLAIRIGALKIRQIDITDLEKLIGVTGNIDTDKPVKEFWILSPGGISYSKRTVAEAINVLSNSEAFAFGVHPPRSMHVFDKIVSVVGLPDSFHVNKILGDIAKVSSRGGSFKLNNRIVLPESLGEAYRSAGQPAQISQKIYYSPGEPTEFLELPMRPTGFIDGDFAISSNTLMAILERGRYVQLRFDEVENKIFEQSAGFRGFRVIGSDIDVIPELAGRFESANIKVRAKSSQILKLQRLERSLNILVLVVSLVALVGKYSILTSSFFANVQRKKVDYATTRLIGMSNSLIFRIPIAQAVIVSSLGFISSVVCHYLIFYILNQFIATELNFDGQLSKLYLSHFVFAGLFVVTGACISSLAASRSATNIDPAEALRAD